MKVLWVEDRRNFIESEVKALRKLGVKVTPKDTASKAIRLLKSKESYDLVILDIRIQENRKLDQDLLDIKTTYKMKPNTEHHGLMLAIWISENKPDTRFCFFTHLRDIKHQYDETLMRKVDPEARKVFDKKDKTIRGENIIKMIYEVFEEIE